MQRGSAVINVDTEGRGPTQRALAQERKSWEGRDVALDTEPRHPNVSNTFITNTEYINIVYPISSPSCSIVII